jgi:hypothetical protein
VKARLDGGDRASVIEWRAMSVPEQIIAAHGGQMGVETGSAGGSLFWFTLPAPARAAAGVSAG